MTNLSELLAAPGRLLDDRTEPDFPGAYRLLTRAAAGLDVAATRIRLSGLRLTRGELDRPATLRVLLMELNAHVLRTEVDLLRLQPQGAERVQALGRLLDQGRLQVRCLPLGGWAPDFSIFHLREDPADSESRPTAALIGPHWMERPYPQRGPALASLHTGSAAERLARRFAELWVEGYDVSEPLQRVMAERTAVIAEG